MAVGEEQGAITGAAEILANGLEILRRERVGDFAGGQAAYAVWRDALLDESQFPAKAPLPLLFERLMCQIDAVTMVAEGRAYAAVYLEETARQFPGQSAPCLEAAALFRRESELAQSMSALTGGFQMGEQQARNLAKPEVRQGIASLIAESAGLDRRAADIVAEVARGLEPMR